MKTTKAHWKPTVHDWNRGKAMDKTTEEEDQQALHDFTPLAEGTHRLYRHVKHTHKPRNVALVHKAEQAAGGLNTRIAVLLTKSVGTMWAAYIFAGLAILGFPGLLGPLAAQLVQWTSQTFIQLTMLAVLMVGQDVLSRHQALQSEEQFNTTQKTYHDIEQVMEHLSAQDEKILEILSLLKPERNPREEMLKENETLLKQTNEMLRQIKALEKMKPQSEA